MSYAIHCQDIRTIIDEDRHHVYPGISAVQIEQDRRVGRRIDKEEQGGQKRADYGKRRSEDLVFATKYKLKLPMPEELNREVARQKELLALQLVKINNFQEE